MYIYIYLTDTYIMYTFEIVHVWSYLCHDLCIWRFAGLSISHLQLQHPGQTTHFLMDIHGWIARSTKSSKVFKHVIAASCLPIGSHRWIRNYPYSCILLTRNWESCKIYCNGREPLLRITGWFAGENMRQECSVAGMNWGMLIPVSWVSLCFLFVHGF